MSVSHYVQILNEILPDSITVDGFSALLTDVKLIQAYLQIIYAQQFDLPSLATDLVVSALFQQIPDVNDRQFALSCDISNFESVLDLVDMICSVYLDQKQIRAQQQKELENESVLNNLQKQMNENQNLINIQQEQIRTLKQTESNQNNVISEYQVFKRNYNTYIKQIQNGYKQIRENEEIWSGKEFTEEIGRKMIKIERKIHKIDEQIQKYMKIKEIEEQIVSNTKEENKELKEQIQLLQIQLDTENNHFKEQNQQMRKLIADEKIAYQQRIKELESQNQNLTLDLQEYQQNKSSTVQQLQTEIQKLKQTSEEISAQIQQTMLEYSISGDGSSNQPLSGVAALKDYIEQVRNQLAQQQQISASQENTINEKDAVLQSLDAKDLQLQEQNSNLTSQLAKQDVAVETISNQLKQQTQQQNLILKSVMENIQNQQSEEIKEIQELALQILQQTDGKILTIDKQLKYLTERNQKQIETTKQLASILQTEQSECEILAATQLLVQKQQNICKSETQLQQELNLVRQQNMSLDQWKKQVISGLSQFCQMDKDNSGDHVSQKLKLIITGHKTQVDTLSEERAKIQRLSENLQVQLKAKQDALDQDTAVQYKISEENQSLKQQLAQLKNSSEATIQQLQTEIQKLKQTSEEISAQIQQTMLEYSISGEMPAQTNRAIWCSRIKDYIRQVKLKLAQQQQISMILRELQSTEKDTLAETLTQRKIYKLKTKTAI
ncbi:Hypothetical_protein [Hexamita inflata]|uniref:Hypothetical_protein n=1 Tax=Hexamita inflata TaxID=28002 RepID=A0AA86Q7N2_9EUKA|nr:Hypothetical protein HINF_LOCUS24875 [Hexamita inflata]CAI9953954.1 Hypothetical protein HINF_LOCUS41599 [Hexamita inflata]